MPALKLTPKTQANPATSPIAPKVTAPVTSANTAQSATSTPMTIEEMRAEIERLKSENNALSADAAAKAALPPTCKISLRGAVSIYGLGRFPLTLYYEQWKKLVKFVNSIDAFYELMHENGLLAKKGDPKPEVDKDEKNGNPGYQAGTDLTAWFKKNYVQE